MASSASRAISAVAELLVTGIWRIKDPSRVRRRDNGGKVWGGRDSVALPRYPKEIILKFYVHCCMVLYLFTALITPRASVLAEN